uniref:C-type lectin domain-containing protein n=1 Tax=Chrysemys picta bellii TaxID=8478 RepID=A0A8C3HY41_CHRPI
VTLCLLLSLFSPRGSLSEHWIGLRREEGEPWKWVNGSEFNNLFPIRGGGNCAYLNDNGVSASRCITERHWVCNKPDAIHHDPL